MTVKTNEDKFRRDLNRTLHDLMQAEEEVGCAKILLSEIEQRIERVRKEYGWQAACEEVLNLLAKHKALIFMDPCIVCGMPVPDYRPEICCNGRDCGCMGQPINPCICGEKCWEVFCNTAEYNYDLEKARIASGIEKWNGGFYELYPARRFFGVKQPCFGGRTRPDPFKDEGAAPADPVIRKPGYTSEKRGRLT